MVSLDGGPFHMGSESAEALQEDGEGPVYRVSVSPFAISRFAVTNEQFAEFVHSTGYSTEAERFGWSFVFKGHVAEPHRFPATPGTPWWLGVTHASWNRPEGQDSSVDSRPHHPVVHVSWNDAAAYGDWAGYRLPTEAEWEFAARGGLDRKTYPWGDELKPKGRHMCNIWQGAFPDLDVGEDGFKQAAPVNAFDANEYGLFNTIGNTWEWCADYFDSSRQIGDTPIDPIGPDRGITRVMKGGSYLCHDSYCRRYRNAARTGTAPDSSTCHIGFRVARDL